MIANFVNNKHGTWDRFLREFAYALRKAVHKTTWKTSAELFLGRKFITPFQKLVMMTDGAEFVVGTIDKLFKEKKKSRFSKAGSSKEDQAHITSEAEETSPGKPVSDLQKNQCSSRRDQYGSEENNSIDQARTTSNIINSPDNKVGRSLWRV
ncbi:uncharacterized protein TNCV_3432521 [Trichonephila clavipes]|nr:uncharacterized protein TNCV_3432521 [Trichonephila clavipes]